MKRSRPTTRAILAIAWIAAIAICGAFAPFLANSNPIIEWPIDPAGTSGPHESPLVHALRPMDVALPIGLIIAAITLLLPARSSTRRALRAIIPFALALAIGAALESSSPVHLQVFGAHERVAGGEAKALFPPIEFSPTERTPGARDLPPGAEPPLASGRTLILGSDSLGQDVASQLIHGCRTALLVSTGSALIAMAFGIALGACMGWFAGWIDAGLMRLVEAAMSIPALLVLVVAAGVLPRTLGVTVAVIGLLTWTDAARLTRAEFMRLRDQDFVLAARATGASSWRIITRHLLPSALPPLLVEASFALAAAILFEASLSFLGLGPAEGASWGRLLAGGLDASGQPLWWISVPAGLIIFLTALSLHALGDTLRHRLSPSR